jgi:putative transposase
MPEVRKIQYNQQHEPWALDCPQRIREHALSLACQAVKNAKKKFAITKSFQMVSFKKKKDVRQSFGFDRQSLGGDYVFKQLKYKVNFYSTEKFDSELEGTRIIRENHRWFLIVPATTLIKIPDNQRNNIVALDPGIKTFVTFYSEFNHGKIGSADFNRIFRLCLCLDKLISKISKAKCKAKRRMRRAASRLRWKIKDLINELHHQTANFLVKNFNVILLPTFETQQMSSKLNSKSARNMLSFAHFRFKQFLKFKAKEYNCKVLDVCEAYTSKTCSYCGEMQEIGSKSILKCTNCGVKVDRDLNGARNIYLRALAVTPFGLN